MSQPELLTVVVNVLHELKIEFMLTGSHASSLQGDARLTHDIDLVVSWISNTFVDGPHYWMSKNLGNASLNRPSHLSFFERKQIPLLCFNEIIDHCDDHQVDSAT